MPPTVTTWVAGAPFDRVFRHAYAPTAFNPGRGAPEPAGRFHFFADERGDVVPAMYGGTPEDVAIAETVFHDVPVRGAGRIVQESTLEPLSIARLRATRDLRLVELLGHGLRALQLRPEELTATEPNTYRGTVAWAAALHAAMPDVDGLLWMSRQFNAGRALVLFGGRVAETLLEVTQTPLPLLAGPGRSKVERAANAARIAIV